VPPLRLAGVRLSFLEAIDHGESEYRTSGPTGSDLDGLFKSNIDIYTKNQHFERLIQARRSNNRQGELWS